MKLLSKEIEAQFPPLYATEDKESKDVPIIAKFFDPCSNWSWFATEYDPKKRIFFGFVKGFDAEMGYFNLDELESVKGSLGLGIERDLYFGEHTLAEAISGRV